MAATSTMLLAGAALRADINLPPAISLPPQAEAATATVWRGESITIELRGHFGGGGAMQFAIVRPPLHGKLSELRDLDGNRASVVYTQDGDRSENTDAFTYVAQAAGRTSSPADVRIRVQEPPPRLQIPEPLDFGTCFAGETETRNLPIKNSGGGVLAGRLTVSSPWIISPSEFHVEAGATQHAEVKFQPHEVRDFVGQVTLTSKSGATATLPLTGSATTPLRIAPSPVLARSEQVSLTNLTDRSMQLGFATGAELAPIAPIELPAKSAKQVMIAVQPEVTKPVHEEVVISDGNFSISLPIDVPGMVAAAEAKKEASPPAGVAPTPAQAAVAPAVAGPTDFPAQTPEAASPAPYNSRIKVTARRVDSSRWQLTWPAETSAGATYRTDERQLSLDQNHELLITWRPLAPKQVTVHAGTVTAQIAGLSDQELHMLRLTALGPDGAELWEAPLVALQPLPMPARDHTLWFFLFLLVALIFWRWRSRLTN